MPQLRRIRSFWNNHDTSVLSRWQHRLNTEAFCYKKKKTSKVLEAKEGSIV